MMGRGTDDLSSTRFAEGSVCLARCSGAFLLTFLLGGCFALGPDYSPPQPELESDWMETADPRIDDAPPADPRWWQSAFGDPVLEHLVDTALDENLTLQSAALRVQQSQQQLAIAVGNQYPQLQQGTGTAAKQRAEGNTFETYQVGLNVSWEADFWGRYRRGVESASASLDATVAGYDGALVSIVGQVAKAYILIRTFQERVRVAEYKLRLEAESLRIARAKFDAGEVSQMPQDLIRRRPDVRVTERQLAAQSAQIGVALTDLDPAFSIGGSIGTAALDSGDLFQDDSETWSVFGAFQWNLFNYGRLKSNVRLQDARFQQLLVDYLDTVLQAQADVENSIVAYLRSHEQLASYRLAAEASQRAVDVASTQGTVAANLVQVYRALGGGWEIREHRDPVEFLPETMTEQMRERTPTWKNTLNGR